MARNPGGWPPLDLRAVRQGKTPARGPHPERGRVAGSHHPHVKSVATIWAVQFFQRGKVGEPHRCHTQRADQRGITEHHSSDLILGYRWPADEIQQHRDVESIEIQRRVEAGTVQATKDDIAAKNRFDQIAEPQKNRAPEKSQRSVHKG